MTEINLLAWRDQQRELQKKRFIGYIGLGFTSAIILVALVNYYAASLVSEQVRCNLRLKHEISQLELQVKEIKNFKKLKQKLIARMGIVQNLQATRILTVLLLNEVITIIPEGIYLYQISRVANKITLLGYAESNTDISNFMRSIEASIWTKDPGLIEIKKRSDADSSDENEFKLSFILKSRTMLAKKL